MFLSPIDRDNIADKKAWENYTIYDQGRFLAFFGTFSKKVAEVHGRSCALDIAASADGVRWEFIARDVLPLQGGHAGFGVHRVGPKLMYYPTCSRRPERTGVHFKVYSSKDAVHWESPGDDFDVEPDPDYYRARWEEVCILEVEEDGAPVFLGYVSSEVREDVGPPGLGMVRSRDGVTWEVLPPPRIEWGELPAQHMEVNFCEKIGDRYYLSLGGRLYLDSYGYSLYTFVGESPYGPFRPDVSMFRLCGTTRRDVTWLGHPLRTPDGLLLALWVSAHQTPEIPSSNLGIGPLKRLCCEDGHLRLCYWEGNECAKGDSVPFLAHELSWIHPAPALKTERDAMNPSDDFMEISGGRDGSLALWDHRFDAGKGFVVEGTLTAWENRGGIHTHQHAAAAGFFLEGGERTGKAVLPDTLGVTRIGELEFAGHRITDDDIYAHAGTFLVRDRSGDPGGTLKFTCEDQVGPFGHASYCGIRHGRSHRFRLIARREFFEFYIDDLYVQTFCLPDRFTGRMGMLAIDGRCRFEAIRAWDLELVKTES